MSSAGRRRQFFVKGVCTMKTRTKISLALLALAAVMAGCQTVKGVGKDIQYAGEKTEEAIKK
jgi:predicted small secreted protein